MSSGWAFIVPTTRGSTARANQEDARLGAALPRRRFIIAKDVIGGYGGWASAYYGAGLGTDWTRGNYGDTRLLVMHEIGHCIGIGLHDDVDGTEVYSNSGFMKSANIGHPGVNNSNMIEYHPDDWNDTFAPDEAFGHSNWCSARIWNKFSVVGEIYDKSSDISGKILDNEGEPINGVLVFSHVETHEEYYGRCDSYGYFISWIPPGNYTLTFYPWDSNYSEDMGNITVPEREEFDLGTLTHTPPPPPSSDNNLWWILILVCLVVILSLAITVYLIKKRRLGKHN